MLCHIEIVAIFSAVLLPLCDNLHPTFIQLTECCVCQAAGVFVKLPPLLSGPDVGAVQITPLPNLHQLGTHLKKHGAEWMQIGLKNTYEGMKIFCNVRDGYKMCADWRGLPHAVEEIARLQQIEVAVGDDVTADDFYHSQYTYDHMLEVSLEMRAKRPKWHPTMSREPPVLHAFGENVKEVTFDYHTPFVITPAARIDATKDMGMKDEEGNLLLGYLQMTVVTLNFVFHLIRTVAALICFAGSDGKGKINYNKYPLITGGTVDAHQQQHPLFLSYNSVERAVSHQ